MTDEVAATEQKALDTERIKRLLNRYDDQVGVLGKLREMQRLYASGGDLNIQIYMAYRNDENGYATTSTQYFEFQKEDLGANILDWLANDVQAMVDAIHNAFGPDMVDLDELERITE